MSLIERINHLVGRRAIPYLPANIDCPHEGEILDYLEGVLAANRREELESHFADCNACCESVALFTRISCEQNGSQAAQPSASEVQNQTAKVLALIEKDERRRAQPKSNAARAGFHLSYRHISYVSLIICAIAAGSIFWVINNQSPSAQSHRALVAALVKERRIEPRVSGGIPHSRYQMTRNQVGSDNLPFDQALRKVSFAEQQEKAESEDRLALARAYLARGRGDDTNRAKAILEALVREDTRSAEAHNDLGVAYLENKEYDQAIAHFEQALEKCPGYPEALFNKALAKERAEYRDQAIEDWKVFLGSSSDKEWKDEARNKLKNLENSSVR
jgi:tetratricopeptide (TPR) repeat protein